MYEPFKYQRKEDISDGSNAYCKYLEVTTCLTYSRNFKEASVSLGEKKWQRLVEDIAKKLIRGHNK